MNIGPLMPFGQISTGDRKQQMKALPFVAALLVAAALVVPARSNAQNVVTDWNAISSSTIVASGGKPSTASGIWFAYASIAVYDAVNATHHRFHPFYFHGM